MTHRDRQFKGHDAGIGDGRIVGLLTAAPSRCRRIDAAVAALAALLCAPAVVAAAERQPLAEIERAAEAFIAGQAGGAEAHASRLDRRLNLRHCERSLEAFLRPGASLKNRTVVGVRCPGSQPWKVYVPVSIAVHDDVLVLSRNLPRGHLLAADDLQTERRDVSRLAGGYATESAQLVGTRLKRSLRAGSIVTPAVVAARVLVRRGQTVTLTAQHDSIAIRVSGKALTDGALNQRIRVQNTTSGRIVEGLVRSAELVEILVH